MSSDYYLNVPRSHQRRSSEGYLNLNDMLSNCEQQAPPARERLPCLRKRRGTNPSLFDGHLVEALRKNYEMVTALADIEDRSENVEKKKRKSISSMVRGGPTSPRGLTKWRNEESTSISSADSALDDYTSNDRHARFEWLRTEVKCFVDDIIDAFESGGAPDETQVEQENQKLSAVQLRKDLKRFYTSVTPYMEVLAALYDLIMWRNPLSTLLLIIVIVYSLFRGWTVALLLTLLLLQLSINYLATVKNINIGWMFMPRKPVTLPKFDISGAQLIFDIAKLAQKLLRFSTNILEKTESLLMWKNPKVSKVFYCLVIYWLCWSVLFTTGTCIGWTVLTIGIRLFFTTYLFAKFPRLRKRFDTYGYFYRNLPLRSANIPHIPRSQPSTSRSETARTIESDDRCNTPMSSSTSRLSSFLGEKFSSRLGSNFNLDQSAAVNLLLGHNHSNRKSTPPPVENHFPEVEANCDDGIDSPHDLAQLHSTSQTSTHSEILPTEMRNVSTITPPTSASIEEEEEDEGTECVDDNNTEYLPLYADPIIDNVIAFRSCVMNEREKIFPMGITSGILYLTDAALVFRSRQTADHKEQLMMLFHDISNVRKVQSLRSMSLITGTRKSLEIHVDGRKKPVSFIGIAKRDDFVTRVQLMCRNAGATVTFSEP
ncbi:unnamed protein product [Caenorhabditis angaria]|uniref:GRAM domain-containing protein n=1 Tax=Caenorhabditis angaria TaxID=860376 RepID=A0A9P1IPF3_9PELO|nr:unnamed protein product [Caenorhabditis angaria]